MVAVTEPHDLYGLALEDFVPERTALAKALRKDGRREQAAEVSSLRKPSVAAWAVNQLVRSRGREIAALFAAGDALEQAQSDLLAGRGDARSLRDAVERERDAVGELAELARGLLSAEGHQLTPATLERVSESLHAAALDEDARTQVKDGCLARELRHVGLGQSGSLSQPASASSSRTRARAKPDATTKRARAADTALRAETKRTERERVEGLKAARRAEADARRAAERAERQLRTAQSRRDDAAESLREAEDALAGPASMPSEQRSSTTALSRRSSGSRPRARLSLVRR
ncbi:MAG: hypothetical protein ABI323_05110 [Solirubrobacteraceae bacterium]